MINQFTNRHYYLMIALDILAFAASLLLAYTTRFEFPLGPTQWTEFLSILPWVVTP